jgi:hypothetical protein
VKLKFETRRTRLPDGIFSNQKSQFGSILECLAMKDVGIIYCHLVYFMAIWYILWPFGICIFCSHFGIFSPFWFLAPKKSGNPGAERGCTFVYDVFSIILL